MGVRAATSLRGPGTRPHPVACAYALTVCPRSLDLFYIVIYYKKRLRLLGHAVYHTILTSIIVNVSPTRTGPGHQLCQ